MIQLKVIAMFAVSAPVITSGTNESVRFDIAEEGNVIADCTAFAKRIPPGNGTR